MHKLEQDKKKLRHWFLNHRKALNSALFAVGMTFIHAQYEFDIVFSQKKQECARVFSKNALAPASCCDLNVYRRHHYQFACLQSKNIEHAKQITIAKLLKNR